MLWGLDRDAWISIWAGTLGAVPAAVISAAVAAWVAVTVLNRSNTHQRSLAAEGVAHQEELAAQQLAEQRTEAGRVRAKDVMANLLGAANGFGLAAEKGPDVVDAQLQLFKTSAYRWEFEASDPEHLMELWKWGNVLWKPSWHLAVVTDAPRSTRSDWNAFLNDATGTFTSVGMTLVQGEPEGHSGFLSFVRNERKKLNARWDELSKQPRSDGDFSPS